MLFVRRVPAPPLNGFVACLWYCENRPQPHALERVLPSGSAQLIVNLKENQTRLYRPESGFACEITSSGSILSGVQSRYSVIDTAETECVAGVSFHPGGTVPFFAVPAHELRDAAIPLDLLWCDHAVSLREQMLEARDAQTRLDILERTLAEVFCPCDLHPAVTFALATFARHDHTAAVSAVADQTGLSPKRFIERFKSAVGVAPKHYCRILRFQRALARSDRGGRVDWTRIALDCGYFDQAHFIHDFRDFSGITPTSYEADRTDFRAHVKFLQSAAGAAVR